jgi:hypothetical protein
MLNLGRSQGLNDQCVPDAVTAVPGTQQIVGELPALAALLRKLLTSHGAL